MSFIDNLSLEEGAPESMEFFDSFTDNEADNRYLMVDKLQKFGLTKQQARVVAFRIFDDMTFAEIARREEIANAQGAFYIYTGAIRHLKEKGYR